MYIEITFSVTDFSEYVS